MALRHGLAAAVISVAMGLVVAAPAGAYVTFQDGTFVSVLPKAGVAPGSLRGIAGVFGTGPLPFAANGNLDYHNGPVVHKNTTYAIYWDPSSGFTTATKNLVNRYFTDVAADSGLNTNVYAVGQQFTETTPGKGRAASDSTFGGQIADTQAYPTTSNCNHTAPCLTKAQLQTEIARVVNDGALPKGMETIYFLFTPPAVTTCVTTTSQCSDDTYCAFHGAIAGTPSTTILYSHDPFTSMDATHAKGCQSDGHAAIQEPNADIADVALKGVSHEHAETITDPLGTGWWDSNTGAENGDKCNAVSSDPSSFIPTLGGTAGTTVGTLFNQSINSHSYYLQSEWSNGDIACRMQPSAGTVTPAFTAPTQASGTAVAFNSSATTSTNPTTSFIWDFGDSSSAFGASPVHTYLSSGAHSVKLTVTDNRGRSSTITQPVFSEIPPVADFTFTPDGAVAGTTVSFDGSTLSTPGDNAITSRSWNFGDGGSSTDPQPQHAYSSAGTFPVTLTVTDTIGATALKLKNVTVAAPPPPPPPITTPTATTATTTTTTTTTTTIPSGTTATTTARARLLTTSLGTIARRGLFAVYDVNKPGTIHLDLVLDGATAKALGVKGPVARLSNKKKAAAPIILAASTAPIGAGRGRVRLVIGMAKLAKLRRRASVAVTLRMSFTDSAGVRLAGSQRLRLSR